MTAGAILSAIVGFFGALPKIIDLIQQSLDMIQKIADSVERSKKRAELMDGIGKAISTGGDTSAIERLFKPGT